MQIDNFLQEGEEIIQRQEMTSKQTVYMTDKRLIDYWKSRREEIIKSLPYQHITGVKQIKYKRSLLLLIFGNILLITGVVLLVIYWFFLYEPPQQIQSILNLFDLGSFFEPSDTSIFAQYYLLSSGLFNVGSFAGIIIGGILIIKGLRIEGSLFIYSYEKEWNEYEIGGYTDKARREIDKLNDLVKKMRLALEDAF